MCFIIAVIHLKISCVHSSKEKVQHIVGSLRSLSFMFPIWPWQTLGILDGYTLADLDLLKFEIPKIVRRPQG
jgi:hypothetical protein